MYNKYLKLAIEASLQAGKAVMDIYSTNFDVEYKDDKSPLTIADKKANTIINTFLKPTEIPIISEENKEIPYNIRKHWDKCWIVDPIDGTKEFIKKNDEFTINIALVENQKPILGVIYAPALKQLFYANVVENKAYEVAVNMENQFINSLLASKQDLKPKTQTKTLKIVGSRSHMNTETQDFVDNLKHTHNNVEIVSKGSSLKFCLVAQGKATIYPRFAPTMEWDTAAGQAICNAAGINVINNITNKPLTYNKENLLNPWFIVNPIN